MKKAFHRCIERSLAADRVAPKQDSKPILAILIGALVLGVSAGAVAQVPKMPRPIEIVFVCPFDASIRSTETGKCGRGAQRTDLVAQVPDLLEFPLELTTTPERLVAGERARLHFEVLDPWRGEPVKDFVIVHEKPFHVFVVGQNLEFFRHEHPRWRRRGFDLDIVLPDSGLYRILTDFLPAAATPQLLSRSVFVTGPAPVVRSLERDYTAKTGENLKILLEAPADPVAGEATTLRFRLEPDEGVEIYLGALGHMLAASEDLIDLLHIHPVTSIVGPVVDFSVVFPRPVAYRVWVQFQRLGTVNTAHFDLVAQSQRH